MGRGGNLAGTRGPSHTLFRRAISRCASRAHHGGGECRMDDREFRDLDHDSPGHGGDREHLGAGPDQLASDRGSLVLCVSVIA